MKLYVVTANTYDDGYGAEIELIGVADNELDYEKMIAYANKHNWNPTVSIINANQIDRKYLGGYVE